MNREDDPQLWDLLEQSSAPKLTPFFARNVLRSVREVESRPSWNGLLSWRRLVPFAAAAVVAVTALNTVHHRQHHSLDRQDAALIADLDDTYPADDADVSDETAAL